MLDAALSRRCVRRDARAALALAPASTPYLPSRSLACIYARFDSGKRQRATRTRRKIISDLPRLRRAAVVPDPSRVLENGNRCSAVIALPRAFLAGVIRVILEMDVRSEVPVIFVSIIAAKCNGWRRGKEQGRGIIRREFPGKAIFEIFKTPGVSL